MLSALPCCDSAGRPAGRKLDTAVLLLLAQACCPETAVEASARDADTFCVRKPAAAPAWLVPGRAADAVAAAALLVLALAVALLGDAAGWPAPEPPKKLVMRVWFSGWALGGAFFLAMAAAWPPSTGQG